jgi:Flp pilus assembly protein TadD
MAEGQSDAAATGELDESATLRAMGNNALREGRHDEAVESYSSAIKLSPHDHRLFSNRAAAYSKLEKVPRCAS